MPFSQDERRQKAPFFHLPAALPALFAGAVAVLSPQAAIANCNAGTTVTAAESPVTATQNIGSNSECTVEQGGEISTTGVAVNGISATNNNAITNYGAISTQGNLAFGISVFNNNVITNSGTISTTGNSAHGIIVSGSGNTVTNSGTISTAGDTANGIFAIGNNTITNSGLIQATGSNSNAVRLTGSGSSLNLQPGSVIIGGLNFTAGHYLSVDNGLSVALTFNNQLPTTVTTSGAPYAVSGSQVAVVDPTWLAMQGETIIDLTSGVSNSVFQAIGAARTNSGMEAFASQPLPASSHGGVAGAPEPGLRLWGKTFGGHRQQDGDSPSIDANNWLVGTLAGVDKAISANTRAGGFLGGSKGEVKTALGTQKTNVDGFYGGVYLGSTYDSFNIGLMVSAGWTGLKTKREVANNAVASGLETARSDYNGYFISPEIGISADIGPIVPSARLRYVGYFIDGYTETGTAAPLTVGHRDLHILHGRFQIALPVVASGLNSADTRIEPYIGVEGRSILDGENVDGVLLGQTLAFDPGGSDNVSAFFGGITGSARLSSNMGLFVGAEINLEQGGSYRYGGNIGAKMTF